jgi:predicted lipoprotein with Yx(FWY)xxD motif
MTFAPRWLIITLCLTVGLIVAPRAHAAPTQQSAALVQVATNPTLGTILVDSQGFTLYELTSETGGKIHCAGGCLKFWPPLLLPAGTTAPTGGTGVGGTLGVITRSDGTQQVTYNGFPLYHFAFDKAPGDTNGNGIVAFEGLWVAAQPTSGGSSLALPRVARSGLGMTASFAVSFASAQAGQGEVYFGSGPGCSGLVEIATEDLYPGKTNHTVVVSGNDFPGTVGDNGIQPGATYWFEVLTVSSTGVQMDNNGGNCYSVTIPSST